ncbi:MAG TPA: rhomboid family intramembrane serine protease [Candidatus Udaeobacter sp.]|nr:rhomboid family intramembrane serine protease [Candidatus Udaeobacter sp.]
MFPLRDDNPSATTPVVTRALIVINLVIFVYELSLGPDLREFFFRFALIPRNLTLAVSGSADWSAALIPLLSSIFLHGGWIHVIGNMWYLWIFGDNIEDQLGHFGYLVFYLVSGVMAGLLHVFTNPESLLPTVGASGAIAGVLGAYAAAFPRARVITLLPLFPFFQVVALPALLVLGFWFVVQFASGALVLAAGASGGVAVWAHVGGFVFGYVVMAVLRGFRRRDAASFEPGP